MGVFKKPYAQLFVALSGLVLCVLAYIFATHPNITPNNRFVYLFITLFAGIFILLGYFMQSGLLKNIILTTTGMFVFAFTLVPLYNVFCDVTGLNGKVDLSIAAATPSGIDTSRDITVEFVVSHNLEMPWKFAPQHTVLKIHPGELHHTAYYAKNTTKSSMTAQAIPSISPARASKYFKKVQCFCFDSQKLGPGESAHLPLSFYLANDLPRDIPRITLSYTIFDITKSENQSEDGSHSHH